MIYSRGLVQIGYQTRLPRTRSSRAELYTILIPTHPFRRSLLWGRIATLFWYCTRPRGRNLSEL